MSLFVEITVIMFVLLTLAIVNLHEIYTYEQVGNERLHVLLGIKIINSYSWKTLGWKKSGLFFNCDSKENIISSVLTGLKPVHGFDKSWKPGTCVLILLAEV